MRKIYVIGVGPGDPDQLTVQAVKALNQVDVFFLMDKGQQRADLADLRLEILRKHVTGHNYRLVQERDPERERPTAAMAYVATVAAWRSRRADIYERMISDESGDSTGAFLVWGDPSLYDSTLAILEQVRERGTTRFEQEVIPGVGSVSALAARHHIGLTQVGRSVMITTGRRLAEGWPEGVDDIVVMLDAQEAFRHVLAEDPIIYWGAYVATADEILVSGRLSQVIDQICRLRSEARFRKGWIMDSYILRR